MPLVIAILVILVFAGLMVLMGRGLTPTRPRPGSRYRGKVFMDVDRELNRKVRRFEKRIGIDRHGRTIWVWLLPPAIGIATAVTFSLVATLSPLGGNIGTGERVLVGIFGFVTMTIITAVYLAWFGDSENDN